MRRTIVRIAAAIAVLTGATVAFAFSTGPPAARTGAFAVAGKPAEPNCTSCHAGGPINTGPGQVEILDLPSTFVAHQTYPLRVRVSFAHVPDATPSWGFQIQAVDSATGDSAGVFVYTPDLKVVRPSAASVFANRRYLEHGGDTTSIHYGQLGPVEWSFDWVAPAGTGRVYFFAAGNAANGDNCAACGDDFIYTDVESTKAESIPVSASRTTWGALKARYR